MAAVAAAVATRNPPSFPALFAVSLDSSTAAKPPLQRDLNEGRYHHRLLDEERSRFVLIYAAAADNQCTVHELKKKESVTEKNVLDNDFLKLFDLP